MEEERKFYYICDRKKCDRCAKECMYTRDIEHARYKEHPPHRWVLTRPGVYYERP